MASLAVQEPLLHPADVHHPPPAEHEYHDAGVLGNARRRFSATMRVNDDEQDPEHDRPTPRVSIAVFAEFVGTAVLVGSGCSAAATEGLDVLAVAFSFGLVLLGLIACLGHQSGAHMNPVVTMAMLIYRRIPPLNAALYFPAQVAGAIVGAALVKGMINPTTTSCVTSLAPGISMGQGILIEAFMTFNLVFVIFNSAVCADAYTKFAPLPIAATLVSQIVFGGKLTGASLNPARSFGPALVFNEWKDQWVYWIGPVLGALVATFVYHILRHYRRIHHNRR